jgi:predicted small lipoprotein YifL
MNRSASPVRGTVKQAARVAVLSAFLVFFSTACGQRGPLFLPDPEPADSASPAEDQADEAAEATLEESAETARDDAFGHEGEVDEETP